MTQTVVLPLLLTLIAAVTSSGFVTWFITVRKTSGSIRTSEATTIWEEGGKIRQELREENIRLNNRVEVLETRVDTLQGDLSLLQLEAEGLRLVITQLRIENERLSAALHIPPTDIETS